MNSYKRVLKVLEEFFEIQQYAVHLMVTNRKYSHGLYETFLPWLVDPIQNPDAIIHLLTVDLPKFKPFSYYCSKKKVIAFFCLCALTKRKPIIEGSWERLVYIIIEFNSKFEIVLRSEGNRFKAKIAVVKWLKDIQMLCSQNQCPSPCLRLELLSISRIYRDEFGKYDYDKDCIRYFLINALCDIHDMYSSLSLDQINMSVDNLYRIMCENSLDILSIMHMDQPDSKKTKLIGAIIKITGMFTRLEKERPVQRDPLYSLQRVNIGKNEKNRNLIWCSSLFYLIPGHSNPKPNIKCFINTIYDKPILVDLMIDTYNAIDAASSELGNHYNEKGRPFCFHTKLRNMIIYMFFKHYVKMLPMHHHSRQVNGGFTLAKERQLKYFSENARPSAIEEYEKR